MRSFKEILEEQSTGSKITETIFKQLGGNRFVVMTGATPVHSRDELHLLLKRNASKANLCKISLHKGSDTYDMKFVKFREGHFTKNFEWVDTQETVIKEFSRVFAHDLQDKFTEVTGLYTHL